MSIRKKSLEGFSIKNRVFHSCFACIIAFLPLNHAFSDTSTYDPDNYVFEMGLHELMTISVASNEQEPAIFAPGIAAKYDTDHMKEMGFNTLLDVLDFIPGIQVFRSTSGTTNIHIRGVSDSNNQKVVLMLDNVPYWMPSHADIPLLSIPFAAIQSIEVLRGAGSVLYGSNASAGVINVITKKQEKNLVSTKFSEHNNYQLSSFYHSTYKNGYINTSVEVTKHKQSPVDITGIYEVDGVNFTPTASGE